MAGKAHLLHTVLEAFGPLKADVFVCAAGCHYNHSPAFLKDMGVGKLPVVSRFHSSLHDCSELFSNAGFGELKNFCFLGTSPRIGTASDFIYGEQQHL